MSETEKLKREAEEMIDRRKTIFCPIINSMCRFDCEAFEMPRIITMPEHPPAAKYIAGGKCTHVLLHGLPDK